MIRQVVWLMACLVASSLCGTVAADPAYVAITIYPHRVQLDSSRDRQRIVVQARYADGRTVEVASTAEVTLSNPKLAAIILFILGCVLYAANNGLPELIGTDLSKYTEWLVFVLAALQGSRTSQILHQEKETK